MAKTPLQWFAVKVFHRREGTEHLSVVTGHTPAQAISKAIIQFDKEFPCPMETFRSWAGKIESQPVNFHE